MKPIFIFIVFFLFYFVSYTQVGIGTTFPNAQLDIPATNVATPANTDGILIPRNAGLNDDSSDNRNVGVGYQALYHNTTGNYNTAVGYSAFSTGNAYTNSTAVGNNAEPNASNTIRLGNSAVTTIGGFAGWTNVSDRRFKKNVRENVIGLDFIKKLRPITYNLDMDAIAHFYKTPDSLRLKESERLKGLEMQTGFIAQEVEQAAKSVNYDFHGVDKPKNENSHYDLRYAEFAVPMVKAVQEQEEVISTLKTENNLLKKRLERLENILLKKEYFFYGIM